MSFLLHLKEQEPSQGDDCVNTGSSSLTLAGQRSVQAGAGGRCPPLLPASWTPGIALVRRMLKAGWQATNVQVWSRHEALSCWLLSQSLTTCCKKHLIFNKAQMSYFSKINCKAKQTLPNGMWWPTMRSKKCTKKISKHNQCEGEALELPQHN